MADVDARTVRPLGGAPLAGLSPRTLPGTHFDPQHFGARGDLIDAFAEVFAQTSQRSPVLTAPEETEDRRDVDVPGDTPANGDLSQSSLRQLLSHDQRERSGQDPSVATSIERRDGKQDGPGTPNEVEDPVVTAVPTIKNAENQLKPSARQDAKDGDGPFDRVPPDRPSATRHESESARTVDAQRSTASQGDSHLSVTQRQLRPDHELPNNELTESAVSVEDQTATNLPIENLESSRRRNRSQRHGTATERQGAGTQKQGAGTQASSADGMGYTQLTNPADLPSNANLTLRLAGSSVPFLAEGPAASLTPVALAMHHGVFVDAAKTLQNLQIAASVLARADVPAEVSREAKAPGKPTTPSVGFNQGAIALPGNTPAAARAEKTPTSDLLSRVKLIQRVSKAFQRLGTDGGTVRLRLAPAELGSVRVEMQVRDRIVQARVVTETEAASAALREHLPELRSRLEAYGMQIERMEVETEQADPGFSAGQDSGSAWNSPQHQRRLQGHFTTGSARQGSASDSASEVGLPQPGLSSGVPGPGVDVRL